MWPLLPFQKERVFSPIGKTCSSHPKILHKPQVLHLVFYYVLIEHGCNYIISKFNKYTYFSNCLWKISLCFATAAEYLNAAIYKMGEELCPDIDQLKQTTLKFL